jgi:hypothetical protein
MPVQQDRSGIDAIRWSGVSLMVGGILLAVHLFTHPAGETAKYAFEPLWVPSHVIGGVAYLLIPLGLVGFYARQARQMGWLGTVALVLTFVGSTLSAGASVFFSVALVPFLAGRGLDWADAPSGALYALPAFQIAIGVSGGGLLIGLLLLAVATLRAQVVPSVGAWLVILTVPLGIVVLGLIFVIGTSQQGLLQAVVGAVGGLGLGAWGWALWSEKDVSVAAAADVSPAP